jgi:hypothetical protein
MSFSLDIIINIYNHCDDLTQDNVRYLNKSLYHSLLSLVFINENVCRQYLIFHLTDYWGSLMLNENFYYNSTAIKYIIDDNDIDKLELLFDYNKKYTSKLCSQIYPRDTISNEMIDFILSNCRKNSMDNTWWKLCIVRKMSDDYDSLKTEKVFTRLLYYLIYNRHEIALEIIKHFDTDEQELIFSATFEKNPRIFNLKIEEWINTANDLDHDDYDKRTYKLIYMCVSYAIMKSDYNIYHEHIHRKYIKWLMRSNNYSLNLRISKCNVLREAVKYGSYNTIEKILTKIRPDPQCYLIAFRRRSSDIFELLLSYDLKEGERIKCLEYWIVNCEDVEEFKFLFKLNEFNKYINKSNCLEIIVNILVKLRVRHLMIEIFNSLIKFPQISIKKKQLMYHRLNKNNITKTLADKIKLYL